MHDTLARPDARPGLPPTAVADAPPACSLLRLTAGGQTLALSIDGVREILEVGRLTAVPRTPPFVRGVMNLRGAVVPVIDLSARLGGAACTLGRRSCIVVVEGRDIAEGDDAGQAPLAFGLLVDGVHEVLDVDADGIEPVPPLGTLIDPRFLAGITRAHGELVAVLAVAQVLAPAELDAMIGGRASAGH